MSASCDIVPSAFEALQSGFETVFICERESHRVSRRESIVHMSLKITCLLGLAFCVVSSAACGGGKSAAEPSSEASSGGDTAQYEGPIAATDVAHGKEVFDNFCGDCHPDGGEEDGPSLIAEPHTPARLRQQIREGSGKMRPFKEKRLSNADMELILAWLASVNAVK
jgi:cytochrome c5